MSDVEFAAPRPAESSRPVQNGQVVRYGDESDLSVQFYKSPVTGKDHIRIAFPGDKHSTFDQPVQEKHKIRFARQWDDYKNQVDRFAGQTRLEEVAWMNEAQADNFRALNIYTVEQLAAVQEGNIHNLGGGARGWIEKARRHVSDQQKIALADEISAREKAMADQIAALQAQIDEMKPKRGRPPKDDE